MLPNLPGIWIAFAILFHTSSLGAQTVHTSEKARFVVDEIATGFHIPWGMTFIDAETMLVTERRGKLFQLNIDTGTFTQIKGLPPILSQGQGGLLDITISPYFDIDGWIYLTYSKEQQGMGTTALARTKLGPKQQLLEWQDLFVADARSSTPRHYGSRIAFDRKGHVFLSIGDRGIRDEAQNRRNHIGTIVRLTLDGQVPSDNPFVKDPSALPEIWSYGHRNPQGLVYDHRTQSLWSIEHGPRGGDEINFVLPGKNYGWPIISYGKEYWAPISVGEGTKKEGMEQPVKYYVPSIAPGSLLLYTGASFPGWQGNLITGALKLTHLNRVTLTTPIDQTLPAAVGEERLLATLNERIRALAQGPDGNLYFSSDSGSIRRIRPAD